MRNTKESQRVRENDMERQRDNERERETERESLACVYALLAVVQGHVELSRLGQKIQVDEIETVNFAYGIEHIEPIISFVRYSSMLNTLASVRSDGNPTFRSKKVKIPKERNIQHSRTQI